MTSLLPSPKSSRRWKRCGGLPPPKYKVLPLDWRGAERFSGELTGKPNPSAGRTHFVYPGPISGIPEATAPDLKNKSFVITAKVSIPDNNSGMIFTQGGNTAGWGFYMQDGKLGFTHNYIDLKRYTVQSEQKLPPGDYELKATFNYSGGKEFGKGGKVELSANNKQIAAGNIEQTTPFRYSLDETQDIGKDNGTPVDNNYAPPFEFNGTIKEVVVDLASAK